MGNLSKVLLGMALVGLLSGVAQAAGTILDVHDSTGISDPQFYTLLGQIDPIATAQTGKDHYDYYSYSAHPVNVNLGTYNSNLWVHQNTGTGEYSFGFVFSIDNSPDGSNQASLNFRIVDSDTNVYVSQSDDAGEAVETVPGAFQGTFNYGHNTDGICVSGITGTDWTIIIDAVNFGDVTNWYASSGLTNDFSDDLTLTLQHEYRISLAGQGPSDEPVIPGAVPVPGALILGSMGLGLVGWMRRRRQL